MESVTSTLAATSPDSIKRRKALVLDSVSSPESKRIYGRGIDRFVAWLQQKGQTTGFTAAAVEAFQRDLTETGLSPSTVNMYVTAIRRLAVKCGESGVLPPELASAIGRVKGLPRSYTTGTPLTFFNVEKLLESPNGTSLKDKRDRALLAVLIACGLTRAEVASLRVEDIQVNASRCIVRSKASNRKERSVQMSRWVTAAITCWTEAAGINTGRIFRAVNKGNRAVGDGMTGQSVFEVVKQRAAQIDLEHVAPNDLRAWYKRLASKGSSTFELSRPRYIK
jgi:site-specific recombinase XerD